MNSKLISFFKLTKPSIMILVLSAGATSLIIEGSFLHKPVEFLLFMLGLYLTGGSANALNQYFERNIDAAMKRTAGKRPLPLGRLQAGEALFFSIAIGLAGLIILAATFNLLTAALALGTILFYSLVYTLILKPGTTQNIVIGGIAGAMAPVGAWTAATGSMAIQPWLLFLMIFFWTPPHFWSLAIHFKKDYQSAQLPMLPNIKGNRAALDQMLYYSLGLFIVSLLPLAINFSWMYMITAILMGIIFLKKVLRARKTGDDADIWGIFKYSIIYLFVIFASLIIDGLF